MLAHMTQGAAVFDPDGVTWTPISPNLGTLRRSALAVVCAVLAIAVAVVAVVAGQPLVWLALAAPVLLIAVGWPVIGRQVRAWGYAERDEDLLVRRGVMFRNLLVVPYGRLLFGEVQAGPLERAFSVAQVQLHTASAESDARIPGLAPQEAARLRDRLASRGQARLAGL